MDMITKIRFDYDITDEEALYIKPGVVSIGLVDSTPVHPREVFADALSDRASGIVVAHNHPTGRLTPSDADLDVTSQLRQAGKILGIELLDHIVFNRNDYFSFLEAGLL